MRMIDKSILEFIAGLSKLNTCSQFIPYAAEKAKYVTCSTHPCAFSHPSANQDKKLKITPIVYIGVPAADGYVRSGNVRTSQKFDMYGSAGFVPIMKFLCVQMSNGRTVLENIKDDTAEAKELLASSGQNPEILRQQFMAAFSASDGQQITSSKIKQVYFPISDGEYHLLSVLTPSPLVFELKERLIQKRKEAFEKRKQRRDGESVESFSEIYDLTRLKYGGTKPQNISKLNNDNAGMSFLLSSVPPAISALHIRKPKRDFFSECLYVGSFKSQFESLHRMMTAGKQSQIPIERLRKWRDRVIREFVDVIAEKVFILRSQMESAPDTLTYPQAIWLSQNESERLNAEDNKKWSEEVAKQVKDWIIKSYKNLYKDQQILLGDSESIAIQESIEKFGEVWK